MNIVIIGANRGIGLGFVRHYLKKGHSVWAGYREVAGELAGIPSSYLHRFVWDVTQDCTERDIDRKKLPESIDLLINNAGIYGAGSQSLNSITRTGMHEVFDVDCVGPLMMVQALRGRLVQGSIIANISSKMGSSADNSSGGTYAYRAAKAALIIVSKSMAIDLASQGTHVITLHPGWVRTDMTHHSGLIDVAESVQGMTAVIERCRQYSPGDFIAFDGALIPY